MSAVPKPQPNPWLARILCVAARIAVILAIGLVMGWTLNRVAASLERSQQPAGFVRGVVQGALMPMSMPNLLVGRDVVIYAANNTGRTYRLGYTLGVNGCGLLFFGLFFWRVRRLRDAARATSNVES
jgi:hypothetical protein